MMRQLKWDEMTEADKAWVYKRGTAAESAEELRTSIRSLVEDVRERGDTALLDALARFDKIEISADGIACSCLLYTSPSPRDATLSRMPSSA